MSQLHFYVPKEVETRLRRLAAARGLTLSKFLAKVVQEGVSAGWPADYFNQVVGGWQGEPLERFPQGAFEKRDRF